LTERLLVSTLTQRVGSYQTFWTAKVSLSSETNYAC